MTTIDDIFPSNPPSGWSSGDFERYIAATCQDDDIKMPYEMCRIVDGRRGDCDAEGALEFAYEHMDPDSQQRFREAVVNLLVGCTPDPDSRVMSRYISLAILTHAEPPQEWMRDMASDKSLENYPSSRGQNLRQRSLMLYGTLHDGNDPGFWENLLDEEPQYILLAMSALNRRDPARAAEVYARIKEDPERYPLRGFEIHVLDQTIGHADL